jgi:hypothetical protein
VDTALSRDPAKRFQHASQMSIALRNRGEAPMSLDWEGYEDATMRTSSLYDAPDDGEPATAPNPDETGPSMAVDAAQLTGPSTETDREDARADTDRPPPLSTATPPWIWAILLLVAAMIAYFLVR